MVVVLKKKLLSMMVLISALFIVAGAVGIAGFRTASTEDYNYRVFIAGTGTVMGKWSGNTGVAVIGVETRPGREKGEELKVIDLLVANNSSVPMQFCSEVNLISKKGKRYGLTSKGQPKVIIDPGALSQGTVIIGVPANIPDKDWTLEIRGGNLKESILLPLRVLKAVNDQPVGIK